MFDLLLQNLPAIISALSALLGVGLFKGIASLYRTYHKQQRKDDAQNVEQRSDRISEQGTRIDSLRERMRQIEQEQEHERKARVDAEVENRRLQATIDAMAAKIDQLVKMVEDLREEAGMGSLSEEEKEDLRQHPDFRFSDGREKE